jgi:hypothetical protein
MVFIKLQYENFKTLIDFIHLSHLLDIIFRIKNKNKLYWPIKRFFYCFIKYEEIYLLFFLKAMECEISNFTKLFMEIRDSCADFLKKVPKEKGLLVGKWYF